MHDHCVSHLRPSIGNFALAQDQRPDIANVFNFTLACMQLTAKLAQPDDGVLFQCLRQASCVFQRFPEKLLACTTCYIMLHLVPPSHQACQQFQAVASHFHMEVSEMRSTLLGSLLQGILIFGGLLGVPYVCKPSYDSFPIYSEAGSSDRMRSWSDQAFPFLEARGIWAHMCSHIFLTHPLLRTEGWQGNGSSVLRHCWPHTRSSVLRFAVQSA